eukprot:XP_001709717.1 Hypothetical protein GL50803_3745 [Giardia lamblia ATCC 50803]
MCCCPYCITRYSFYTNNEYFLLYLATAAPKTEYVVNTNAIEHVYVDNRGFKLLTVIVRDGLSGLLVFRNLGPARDSVR